MAPLALGPRQTTGVLSSTKKPIDITCTPWARGGTKYFCSSTPGLVPGARPSIIGKLGPKISASNRPTRAPSAASANAKLTVVVDLPTPPLPEDTSTTFFTLGKGRVCPCVVCERTSQPMLKLSSDRKSVV